jgi:hypothetical protein
MYSIVSYSLWGNESNLYRGEKLVGAGFAVSELARSGRFIDG